MKWRPYMGIRGKFLIAFVGLALAPLAFAAALSLNWTLDALVTSGKEELRLNLESNVAHVEHYFTDLGARTRTVASWLSEADPAAPTDTAQTQADRLLLRIADLNSDFYQVRMLSTAGMEQARVNRSRNAVDWVPHSQLQDKSKRYYVQEAIAYFASDTVPTAPYFSPIDLNREHGIVEQPHRLVFRVGHVIKSPGSADRQLLVINVFAQEILERLEAMRPNPQGEVLLIGGRDRVIKQSCVHGDCTYSFGNLRDELGAFPTTVHRDLLDGGRGVMTAGNGAYLSYAPITAGGARWKLAIVYPQALIAAPVNAMKRRFALLAVLVALAALMLAVAASRALARPTRRILGYVNRVAQGKYDVPPDVRPGDEIGDLAAGVCTMVAALQEAQAQLEGWNDVLQASVDKNVQEIRALLETKMTMERQLCRADRLASLGLLSASAAHEIGNPLGAIKTALQVVVRDPTLPVMTRETLELVFEEIDRLTEILGRMRGFVRTPQGDVRTVTLRSVYSRVVFLVESDARKKRIQLALTGDAADTVVMAPENKLEQVLLNLLVNALQAMPGPGDITVDAALADDIVRITVADTGPGIPEEQRARIFDPLYTTKAGGTGLGLAIVRQLIEELGGAVGVDCPDSGGTIIRMSVPAARTSTAQTASCEDAVPGPTHARVTL